MLCVDWLGKILKKYEDRRKFEDLDAMFLMGSNKITNTKHDTRDKVIEPDVSFLFHLHLNCVVKVSLKLRALNDRIISCSRSDAVRCNYSSITKRCVIMMMIIITALYVQ